MGCTLSQIDRDAIARSKEIDKNLNASKRRMSNEVKLLLLGAGESGKSTILKQLRLLFLDDFKGNDRNVFRPVVWSNTLQSMAAILRALPKLGIVVDCNGQGYMLVKRFFEIYREDLCTISPEMFHIIAKLWADDAIQQAYGRAREYQLNDSASYFLNALSRISDPDYVPTMADILRTRVKTTGIVEISFVYDKKSYRVFDVGGQRSERKKWIHCFEDVTAVIFCASLAGYDLRLSEDDETNRMIESINLFGSINNSPWFVSTSMILLLNKMDLFVEKLRRVSLSFCFKDYKGDNSVEDARQFIVNKFEETKSKKDKDLYVHFTCATDTKNIEFVFDAVNDVIMKQNLKSIGLI